MEFSAADKGSFEWHLNRIEGNIKRKICFEMEIRRVCLVTDVYPPVI